MMATKKPPVPCKRLDLDAMTNAEVIAELERVYDDILGRLSAHLEVARDETVGVETATVAVEQGVMLSVRVDALGFTFENGWSERSSRPQLGSWNWGRYYFADALEGAACSVGRRERVGA